VIVLDTATWIWRASDPNRLPRSARRAIDRAEHALVSAISVWEVAMLVAKRRIQLDRPVEQWVTIALALPGIELAPLDPAVAVRGTRLARRLSSRPGGPHHRRDGARARGSDHHAGRQDSLVSARPVRVVNADRMRVRRRFRGAAGWSRRASPLSS